jgi:hypothetical protein
MKSKGKYGECIKARCNLDLNAKKKVLKHGLVRDYDRFPSRELVKCIIGYTIEVFALHKCSQLLYKFVFVATY